MATELFDDEFGEIVIRRTPRSRSVRLRVTAKGTLAATMPPLTPLFLLKQLVDSSRPALRRALVETRANAPPLYRDGDIIGSSHRIEMERGESATARCSGQTIRWRVPLGSNPDSPAQQDVIRKAVRKALDVEAKAYLPRRLRYLADQFGFSFREIRYSNAKGRWGSCSSRGVISLNVALMRLPMEYVDYVLIHELSHTRHLNHSTAFWAEVERCFPDFKSARKQLKTYNPYL